MRRNQASRRGRAPTSEPGREFEAIGNRPPRFREAPAESSQPKARIAESVADRLDARRHARLSANRARRWAGVRDPEAATERETRKRQAPESSPELASLHGDQQRPSECGSGEHRSSAELPLRADEQPTQPRRSDPRKHLDRPSKARACRKHRRNRARSRAHAGVRRREGGGPAAASADKPSATPVARSLTLG